MTESAKYDVSINEVAKILDKSDRQVRRYVKEHRLKAKPVRIEGHVKLMFCMEEVEAFKRKFTADGIFTGQAQDSQVSGDSEESAVDPNSSPEDSVGVKYVIDVLKGQITHLQEENRDLHYQLEQRSGQVGFLQGQIEALQAEVKMLAPMKKAEEPNAERTPWYRRLLGMN